MRCEGERDDAIADTCAGAMGARSDLTCGDIGRGRTALYGGVRQVDIGVDEQELIN